MNVGHLIFTISLTVDNTVVEHILYMQIKAHVVHLLKLIDSDWLSGLHCAEKLLDH